LLEDAARSEADIDASQDSERPFSRVPQDMRLNSRWLDLRVPANNAIMRLRSGIATYFRQALLRDGFMEIQTPKLIGGESEGGAGVFRTDYFGTPACLAQSPQLYKQMAISADFDRVFEVAFNSHPSSPPSFFLSLSLSFSSVVLFFRLLLAQRSSTPFHSIALNTGWAGIPSRKQQHAKTSV
jgi:aspartyl-tRNA synthetase